MTPDELDAIRERAKPPSDLPVIAYRIDKEDPLYEFAKEADDDRAALLAYVEELERERARSVVRYAGIVADGENHARAELRRNNHLRATLTELSHHGDMTPTAKRVLMKVLDGAE